MRTAKSAFSLVEVLVVIGIIAILIAIILPALSRARDASKATVCMSNLHQLHTASVAYIAENRGYWPPAHYDFSTTNLHRWHGTRATMNDPFNFAFSPLRPHLQTARIKQCPSFEPAKSGFEASAGGYGYNNYYVGSSLGSPCAGLVGLAAMKFMDNTPAKQNQIHHPAEKIAFADSAMADPALIEYSFVEPPTTGGTQSSPSIHFRHRKKANIAWADGHVTSEPMTWTYPTNGYGADNSQMRLGFVGPRDNHLFQRD